MTHPVTLKCIEKIGMFVVILVSLSHVVLSDAMATKDGQSGDSNVLAKTDFVHIVQQIPETDNGGPFDYNGVSDQSDTDGNFVEKYASGPIDKSHLPLEKRRLRFAKKDSVSPVDVRQMTSDKRRLRFIKKDSNPMESYGYYSDQAPTDKDTIEPVDMPQVPLDKRRLRFIKKDVGVVESPSSYVDQGPIGNNNNNNNKYLVERRMPFGKRRLRFIKRGQQDNVVYYPSDFDVTFVSDGEQFPRYQVLKGQEYEFGNGIGAKAMPYVLSTGGSEHDNYISHAVTRRSIPASVFDDLDLASPDLSVAKRRANLSVARPLGVLTSMIQNEERKRLLKERRRLRLMERLGKRDGDYDNMPALPMSAMT